MQTTQPQSPTSESGFDPIPTRIENVPPLIVDKVDDATKELMVSFYKQLTAGKAPSLAMQNARKELIAGGKYNHPAYWGAFIVSGDFRAFSKR